MSEHDEHDPGAASAEPPAGPDAETVAEPEPTVDPDVETVADPPPPASSAEDGDAEPGAEEPAPASSTPSPRAASRRHSATLWLLAVALGVLTTALLARGHRDVGYARDEGIYFDASRSYAAWVAAVAEDPGRIGDRKLRDQHFRVNHEHPVLMKTLAGLSARWLAGSDAKPRDGRPVAAAMPEGAAMRLPAQILAGLGVAMLFLFGATWRRGGITAGLLAAGAFILLPRVAFHAGLHAFDVPIAVATLGVALAYRASLRHRGWSIAVGPLLGLAIAVKHNALFLGPLLAVHYYACLAWGRLRHGHRVTAAQWVPLPLVGMATLAPLVAWALWPWMWSDTSARLMEYLEFHRNHSWYNMELLGVNYNQPPMPISYPAIMTWATVPTVLLLLSGAGLVLATQRDLRMTATSIEGRPRWWAPLPAGWSRLDALWLALLALFPLVLISLPSTPIFGGTKHWLTAYPFLALAAAAAWRELWRAVQLGRHRRWLAPVGLVLCLGPAAIATLDGHPYNLSQYAPLAGGPRGAADLGLNRGFWGHAVHDLWPTLAQTPGPIYLHDMHELSRRQYEREGRWPPALAPADVRRARSGLLFHELHMAADEQALWERFETTAPVQVLSLDDVPLTSLYAQPIRDPDHGR